MTTTEPTPEAIRLASVINEAKAEALRSQAEFFRQIDMPVAADHCEQAAISYDSSADDDKRSR